MAETYAQWMERTQGTGLLETGLNWSTQKDYLINEKGQRICGGNKAGTFGQGAEGLYLKCRNTRLQPNGKCDSHGGRALRGPAHHNYSTGRYSNSIPYRLQYRYEKSLQDPDLLSMRDEIALLCAREEELLISLDHHDSGELYVNLKRGLERLNKLVVSGNGSPIQIQNSIEECLKACSAGVKDSDIWIDLRKVMDDRRRLSESEQALIVRKQQLLTTEEATVLNDQIIQAAIECMPTQNEKTAFISRLEAIYNRMEGSRDITKDEQSGLFPEKMQTQTVPVQRPGETTIVIDSIQ